MSKNRKQMVKAESNNKKDDAFKVINFNRKASEFKGYPVTKEMFYDGLESAIQGALSRVDVLRHKEASQHFMKWLKATVGEYQEALREYEAMSEKTRLALKVQKPVNPINLFGGVKKVNPVVTIRSNAKRDLNAIWLAIQSDNKAGLTESEAKYSGQLKSIYTALKGQGSGLLNEALSGKLNESLEVKLQGLTVINDRFQNQFDAEAKKESERTGKPVEPKQATFYRNNAPYVKTVHAMVTMK